ncbi:sodium:proline symporter [Synergistales bacterium]|nr:sodium:proline symporter [Synergistales bacterium]
MNTHLVVSVIVLIAYTVFTLYVGMGIGYSKETVSTVRGYFLGNGTGFFILYFTTAATWFSTWIYMGAPGSFYKFGIGWVAGMTWQILIMVLMGYFGPKFWRLSHDKNYITPADLMQDYYNPGGKGLRISVAVGQIIFCIPTMMAQVSGVGLAIATLTNGIIPFWFGCVYAATVVGIYVYFGGFKSQAWVDTMQGILFTVILWVSVFIMLVQPELNGFAGLFSRIEAMNIKLLTYMPSTGYWNWKNYVGFFVVQAMGGFFAPYVWQRMYAAKNGQVVRMMAGTLGIFYCFAVMLPVMLVGFGGFALGVETANADNILVTAMNSYAPVWGIFVVTGILAAGMSTISSITVAASSILSVDFIKAAVPDISSDKLNVWARWCVLGMMVMSVAASLLGTSGIVLLINTALAGFTQAFWPVFGIFVWKRATKEGATLGWITGIVVTLVLTLTGKNIMGFIPGLVGFVLNGAVFFGVSFLSKPIDKAQHDAYMEPLTKNAVMR